MHTTGTGTVVLVEGVSDQVALTSLARARGIDLADLGVEVVAMGGATNIGHFVREYGVPGRHRLAGLCDVGELRFYRRALERAGLGTRLDPAAMEQLGFFVCARDLEDELIRALGPERTQEVLTAEGEEPLFRVFQRQPDQRHKRVEDQLRRFLGTHSGRKARYAQALVEALPPAVAPRPLAALLAWL